MLQPPPPPPPGWKNKDIPNEVDDFGISEEPTEENSIDEDDT